MSAKIDQAFVSAFITGAFGLPIAHENADYTPTPGTAFVELSVAQNEDQPFDMADTDSTTGLFQFVLNYPEGGGAIAAKTMADTILATFPIGLRVTYSGQAAEVTGRQRFSNVPEDGWYRVRCRVFYRAYIAR